MKGNESRERTIYDASLSGIFFLSGLTVFIILLLACAVIGITVFFSRRSDPEGIKIVLFCSALVVPCSYGIPFVSLLKVWKQERRLGIYWKDRTDHDLPKRERDWYLGCDRGGFILYHRDYIKRITDYREEIEIAENARGKVHSVLYEDIDGKKHKLKFSCESSAKEFQKWFEMKV